MASIFVVAWGCGAGNGPEGPEPGTDLLLPALPAYVEDADCAACHAGQYRDWSGSHHDLAMQVAAEDSVLGDFNDTAFTNDGVTTRFFTENGRFMVNAEGGDGQMADFEVTYTFGVEPLQQYLVEFPGGRLQALGVAWDTERGRWFHLYPGERIGVDDPLHWTGPLQNWNFMCAECHSTNLRKNFELETDSYDTDWDAVNVGCQACHGPGESHVEWANVRSPETSPREDFGLTVDFIGSDPAYQVDSCAACHSRRRPVSAGDRAGEPFLDHFLPETLAREDLYHADGQILGEVYVYGSFVQSRMYRMGVACSDCHNPHSLNLRFTNNALCGQCHDLEPPLDRFETMEAKNYDSPEHHFHPVDSAGAQCVNCHMAERTYMVVDPRRDHSFRIPRPDLSVTLGTPNACNDCHIGESAQWASDAVARWYGPGRRRGLHFGEALAAGRAGDPEAGARLTALFEDSGEPAIVRATALDLLSAYGAEGRPALTRGLRDSSPLVRASAVSGLEQSPSDQLVPTLTPLLRDPVRAVRMEAARVLAPAAPGVPGSDREILAETLAEYEEVQLSLTDTAAAHLNLGVVHNAAGDTDRALDDYMTALEREPGFMPASINLANLLNQLGRNPEAEQVLADAIAWNGEEGELYFSLGLLQAEMNRLAPATANLERAADLLPGRPRVRYNYGLALQQTGRRPEAEIQFLESYRVAPDPSVVQALAIFYFQDARWEEALEWAERLVEMLPEEPGARLFLEQIRRSSGG